MASKVTVNSISLCFYDLYFMLDFPLTVEQLKCPLRERSITYFDTVQTEKWTGGDSIRENTVPKTKGIHS